MKDNLLKSRICDKTTLYKWLETEKVLYLGNDIKTQVKKLCYMIMITCCGNLFEL
jgi:hypothetical protein